MAELLIALAILGVIATFTIPKVLNSQQDARFKSIGKETAAMISGAYQAYTMRNTPTANTLPTDLTPYMNFVKVDTLGTTLDDVNGTGSFNCGDNGGGGVITCLQLHNGAALEYVDAANFFGTATTNALYFQLDPDGKYSGTTNGPGKGLLFFLYFNGKVRTWGTAEPNTIGGLFGGTVYNPTPSKDPTWFAWD